MVGVTFGGIRAQSNLSLSLALLEVSQAEKYVYPRVYNRVGELKANFGAQGK